MRFGKTLRTSTYQPWKDKYIDYAKLKQLLRDDKADEDDSDWTEEDENRFCDELFNAQLEKVAMFQEDTVRSLRERVDTNFERLRELTPSPDEGAQPDQAAASSSTAAGKGKEKSEITVQRLKDIEKELDQIVDEVRELKKYSNLNYTGFLKIAKKHDRKRGSHYRIRPMMQVSLARRPFNSEKGYAPLLSKLSVMYEAIHQYLDDEETLPVDLGSQPETHNGERYTAYKFWIHPDNLLEVKTMILRHLPALVYSDSSAKEPDASTDPTLTSLYFDNSNFELYTNKVERTGIRSSVRLRWYGQLSNKPDIHIERKIVQDNGVSEELKFDIKEKYVKQFLDGEYRMEKTVSKMERQGETTKEVDEFKTTVDAIQSFVQDKKLDPVLRANYVRSAFQKPNDDRVRISIDTDLAFIREDTLDERRPCREPSEWHRRDIDNRNLTYPFKDLASGDISRFPFAVLEIKLKDGSNKRRAAWIEDLMASHLLHPSPLFSKFVHGVAVLFDDYVNRLPFWLSDLETDIRKDPQVAFEEEEKRRSQRATDELAVGVSSLLAKAGSFKPSKSSPIAKSYLAERAAEDAAKPTPESVRRYSQAVDDETTVAEESSQNYGATSSVLPSFSLTRYSKWKRAQSQPLPEGVEEPTEWIKNTGPLQIEPKVWLANERTFLKWQHICILLGGLAVALYTAAGENFLAEMMGIAYIVIAVFAGLWGYYMMQTRRQMIVGRSGKDFDNMFGPLVISVALMVALILNFVFAYKSAFEKWDEANKGAGFNETSALPFVDEL